MIKLGSKRLETPIIQGGMGIAISLGSLAGAVMKEGGMGVISAAQPGFRDPRFLSDPLGCNLRAMDEEARKARKRSQGRGLLGINIMYASSSYGEYCRQAQQSGYDAILSGAGLALDLPSYVTSDILIAPIVSSARALSLILRVWDRRYGRRPDFVVVEGPEAGGHLGFSKDDLQKGCCPTLEAIVQDVCALVPDLPVFAAGGIFDHNDVQRVLDAGASGVQAATRFLATEECDAPEAFKQLLIRTEKDDLRIVDSPAGFPARAIATPFVRECSENRQPGAQKGSFPFTCTGCLKQCAHAAAPYCISRALMEAAQGNLDNGLFFTGSNAARITGIECVEDVIKEMLYG